MTALPVRGRRLILGNDVAAEAALLAPAPLERLLDSHSEQSGRRRAALRAKGAISWTIVAESRCGATAITLSSPPGWAANPCLDVGSGATATPELTQCKMPVATQPASERPQSACKTGVKSRMGLEKERRQQRAPRSDACGVAAAACGQQSAAAEGSTA